MITIIVIIIIIIIIRPEQHDNAGERDQEEDADLGPEEDELLLYE